MGCHGWIDKDWLLKYKHMCGWNYKQI
jgi:hypothetical protein